jgi:CheY-like chemotaxis protein
MTSASHKILVVDDDPDAVTFIGSLLRSFGMEPVAAGCMADGLCAAHRACPCCIILNGLMCGEEGLCLYRTLRTDARLKDVPVILLSNIRGDTWRRSGVFSETAAQPSIPEPEAFLAHPPDAEALRDTLLRLTRGAGPAAPPP